jgi:hypothetical protein
MVVFLSTQTHTPSLQPQNSAADLRAQLSTAKNDHIKQLREIELRCETELMRMRADSEAQFKIATDMLRNNSTEQERVMLDHVSALKAENEQLRAQLGEDRQAQLRQPTPAIKSDHLQIPLSQGAMMEISQLHARLAEQERVVQGLQRELALAKRDASDVQQLRMELSETKIDLRSERVKAAEADRLRAELAVSQASCQELSAKLQEFTSGDISRDAAVARLQRELAVAQARPLEVADSYGLLQSRLTESRSEIDALRRQLQEARGRASLEAARAGDLQAKLDTTERQRDAARNLFNQLAESASAVAPSAQMQVPANAGGGADKPEVKTAAGVVQSVALVAERERVGQLELELRQAQSALERAKGAELECQSLRHQLEEAEQRIRQASQQQSDADCEAAGYRILHMRTNPLSRAQEHRQQVEQVASGVASGEGAVAVLQAEVGELKSKLHNAETRSERLKAVFQDKINEFRSTCYMLTGYRIDLQDNGMFRLHNMYAERPGDELLFRRSADGKVELLETAYSSELGALMEVYLGRLRSIPGFLSALTIELVERQTMQR